MRLILTLIPSLLFLLAYAGTEGLREEELARMQLDANLVTAEMNKLSANISEAIQGATLGGVGHDDVQEEIDKANQMMASMRGELEQIWSTMDELKVKAARDTAIGRILRSAGILSGIAAFAVIGSRRRDLMPYCLLASALLLGLAAV